MDSLPEDMTMRTLIKGMIADEVPQSMVHPGTKSRLQKTASSPKKLINIEQSPTMVLRSHIKAKRRSCVKYNTARPSVSSIIQSTRNNSPAPKKAKTVEANPQEALDDYTPRILLKKFMQTELESSLVKVANSKKKKSVQKKSQHKAKLSSGSNDSFGLSLPAEDTTEEKLLLDRKVRKQKISVSEFEKATQQRLQLIAETQQNEQVELCEKSTKLPDVSTIIGLINPEFDESTTKPILCRRPVKRKVINEDDFEEGVHNYLEQEKEPEEIEGPGSFEKTSGLTDISRIVGLTNFDIDESVSKPVLSRRPKRDKLISEDDFEEGVLFYLQQAKEKPFPEVQDASSDSTGKEKSCSHTQQDKLAATVLYTSPWPTKSNGMKAASAGTEEITNVFGLNSGLDLEKEMELSVPAEEESVKMAYAGRTSSHCLIKEKNLTDTDHQIDDTAEKPMEDLQVHEESMDHGIQTEGGAKEYQSEHRGSESAVGTQYSERTKAEEETAHDDEYQADYKELEVARDAEQNFATLGGQESAALRHSEGVNELVFVDEIGDKEVESDDVNDERMEVKSVECDKVDDENTQGEEREEDEGGRVDDEEGGEEDEGGRVEDEGGRVEDEGGRVEDEGGRVEDEGGRVEDEGGRVEDEGGRVEDEGGRVEDEGGRVEDEGGRVEDEGGRVEDEGGRVEDEGGRVEDEGGRVEDEGGRVEDEGGRVEDEEGGEEDEGGRVEDEEGGEEDEGGRVEDEGGRVEDEGGRVEDEGGRVEDEGGRVEVEGGRVEVEGGRVEVEGGRVEVEGGRVEVEGGRVEDEEGGEEDEEGGEEDEGGRVEDEEGGEEDEGGRVEDEEGGEEDEGGRVEDGGGRVEDEGGDDGEFDDERMEDGDEASDERMEDDEGTDEEEHDEVAMVDNSEYEEDDSKVRPPFQQSEKVFKSSPLLTTPHFLKILGSKAQKPLVKVKQHPKKPTQKRKKTILPNSFVKSVFTHYAKMRVKKETFAVVEQCLELYFEQLCDDVDVYSKHAKRRTVEKEDLELLMKRQGFVTAKAPLNVLIEHHLPMECREKLIPMAVSGSKIIPKK
ncbi:uncharacterized protein LOC144492665 isoform X2 [Mustelus asterias]